MKTEQRKRTAEALVELLRTYAKNNDYERAHHEADVAVIEFVEIEFPEVAAAWRVVGRWYA